MTLWKCPCCGYNLGEGERCPICDLGQGDSLVPLSPAEQSFLLDLLKHEREDIFFKVQSLKVAGRAFAQLSEEEAAGLVEGLIAKLTPT